jgi:uncharacterized membrane protein YbhN (UPF0104 family)
MAKLNSPIRLWVSRGIIAAGVVWIAVVFSREAATLKASFVVDSPAWLAYTIAAGCVALLFTVPIFRAMLETHTRHAVPPRYAARLLFVAQILRHLPGRFWGVMYLVNETRNRFSAASMVRANVDFMLYSMAFNLLTAGSLVVAVTVGPVVALVFAIAGTATLTLALRINMIGKLTTRFSIILPGRFRRFMIDMAPQLRLPWSIAVTVSGLFVLVWLCYLSVWWALPEVFASLRDVNIWLLCASYSLAWVIGYLAMITPGGLGVREAGFFALASPLMGLPELTFLAVFVRVWQILVESLMFLAFAFVKPSDAATRGNRTNAA